MTETTPRFPLLVLDVDPAEADDASAELFERGATGVEERDATTLVKGTSPGKTTLVASFADFREAEAARGELPAAWGARHEEIVGDAWRDDWKKHFRPFEIFPGFVVRPPWEAYDGPAEHVVELEPGRAFGTGLHETTSLVAGVFKSHPGSLVPGAAVLDVGCGSGILSIVALTLGAATARAIDVDPDAVAVTRENAERNGLASRVVADTAPVSTITERYPTVLANIEAGVLCALAPAIMRCVLPGGTLVLSGILAADVIPGQDGTSAAQPRRGHHQLDAVRAAYDAMEEVTLARKGEWVALVLRAKEGA